MSNLHAKVLLFLDNLSPDWQLDNTDGRLTWRPLWLTPELANDFFWNKGQKFILMSASFYPKHVLAKTLGLDVDDLDYYSVPSTFPVSNRPVYVTPVANMTAKTVDKELPKLVEEIKRICDLRPDVKGIIHAVSYKLSNDLVRMLGGGRYITHNGQNRQEVLKAYIESPNPDILISPSLERGVSLQDDLCRLIIIAKAPYLSLGDKIVRARLYSGKLGQDHYTATMLLSILQMCGRGVRSADDYAETFILDYQVQKCITERPSFLPVWFKDAMFFEMPEESIEGKEGVLDNGNIKLADTDNW
jgi:Rad3-related DNA helicase